MLTISCLPQPLTTVNISPNIYSKSIVSPSSIITHRRQIGAAIDRRLLLPKGSLQIGVAL